MRNKKSHCLVILLMSQLSLMISNSYSQALTGYTFRIVNMMPNAQSNETTFDSETNIAVNPANTLSIVGSAFTRNPTGSTTTAPIYVSANGGSTWSLSNIVPSGNGMTGDISVGFASTSNNLYTGILRGGSSFREMILRTNSPTGTTTMTTLLDRSTARVDQPFVSATTVNDSGTPRDRVFVGGNNIGDGLTSGGDGRTAEVSRSNQAETAPPSGFANLEAEPRSTSEQDFPAIRTAIHNSGVVYAIFYNWMSGTIPSGRCDVIVVRDDNFATGTSPFRALNDATDSNPGQRVVTNRLVPGFSGTSLGNNRLVGSNLAIAVDPNNSANVFIAWCDRVGTNDYTLHFRRSTNSGQAWGTADLLTITNATNPGIAITTNGKVGMVYQQLTGTGASARWETHFRLSNVTASSFTDDILSTFLDSDLAGSTISPSLGDYLDMEAVGNVFYGVFPASNRPINTNFPLTVTYRRNADFTTNQLRNLTNTANVNVSVDPFFFKISPSLLFFNICKVRPEICRPIYWDKIKFRIPPFPCLTCPPFKLPFEKIYEDVFKDRRMETQLVIPYFHLFLDGYDPQNFDIKIVTRDGELITQEINKTEKGYAISFRPEKDYFNAKEGIRNLDLIAVAKNPAAAKKGAEFNYQLEASDYRFKEHLKKGK
jgi:hypothetical protein